MRKTGFHVTHTNVPLEAAPINDDWILEGTPTATSQILARSSDGSAYTVVWDCTPGVFTWRYDVEETIHLLDGKVLLSDTSGTRAIGAGDVVFFPAGTQATWRIESRVRKLAFFHHTLPRPLQFITRWYYQLHVSGIAKRFRRACGALARIAGMGVASRVIDAQSTSAW